MLHPGIWLRRGTQWYAKMASGISMHASSLAGASQRRVAPAVSCSLRPSLPQVGLCLLGSKGIVSRAGRAPFTANEHPMGLVDPSSDEGSWPVVGKGRA